MFIICECEGAKHKKYACCFSSHLVLSKCELKQRGEHYFLTACCEVKRGQRGEGGTPAGFSLISPSTFSPSQCDG